MAQAPPPHPQASEMVQQFQGHLEIPNNRNHMHTTENVVEGASVPPLWVNLMSMFQQNQALQISTMKKIYKYMWGSGSLDVFFVRLLAASGGCELTGENQATHRC